MFSKFKGEKLTVPTTTRIFSDDDRLNERTLESMSLGNYKLNSSSMYSSCFQNDPGYNASSAGGLSGLIDVDSELKNIPYHLSKCNQKAYSPHVNCNKCKKCDSGKPCPCPHCLERIKSFQKLDCSSQFQQTHTRVDKPCNLSDSSNQKKFEDFYYDFPFKSVNIQDNTYIGQNTRQYMKVLNNKLLYKDNKGNKE
jgi:hypothetical protein